MAPVTQAKRLDQIPEQLSEVALLMTGTTVPTGDWELEIRYEGLGDDAAAVRHDRAELQLAERLLTERTREVVNALREHGVSLRDIGTMTGLTHQRVHQLVS
jgi:DNA-directed RNA polymerase specialized sigma24 family protein